PPPAPPSEAPPFYADALGDVLVIGGAAAAVGGVLVYRAALHDLDLADASATYDQHASYVNDARTKRLFALAIGAGSVGLVAVGVLPYRARSHHDRVAIAPVDGGAIVSWLGTWP